ncbi:MAG: hypothetical protein ACI9U2_000180, partial [Bradymonadia bacterium]
MGGTGSGSGSGAMSGGTCMSSGNPMSSGGGGIGGTGSGSGSGSGSGGTGSGSGGGIGGGIGATCASSSTNMSVGSGIGGTGSGPGMGGTGSGSGIGGIGGGIGAMPSSTAMSPGGGMGEMAMSFASGSSGQPASASAEAATAMRSKAGTFGGGVSGRFAMSISESVAAIVGDRPRRKQPAWASSRSDLAQPARAWDPAPPDTEVELPAIRAPHLASVMAALDAGLVANPAAPVRFGRLGDDWVVDVPRAAFKAMLAAGWQAATAPDQWHTAPCWPAITPLDAVGEPSPPLGEVIFISATDDGFLTLAAELVRLGCDEVTVCAFGAHVACRVPEPPYFAVLRALDPATSVRAYGRSGRRIWTRLGFAHARVDLIDPPPKAHLLLDPVAWITVPDGPWTDVHQHLVVRVQPPSLPQARSLDAKLSVELRLVRAPAGDPPTLWMITDNAHAQLDALVTRLPQAIVQRLLFAVAGPPSAPRVILRARRGRAGPPVIEIEGRAYGSWLRVPNLLVPEGRTLDPPLRLVRVRALLAPNPDVLVMLEPTDDAGGFQPIHLAEDAFTPLADWVDYVIGAAQDVLVPWISDARFDFEAFMAMDVEWQDGPRTSTALKPPPVPAPVEAPKPGRRTRRGPRQIVAQPETRSTPPPLPVATLSVSEAQVAAAKAEAEFCAVDVPHDDPARGPLWARLAVLEHAAGRPREAGLCWANAIWMAPPEARAGIASQWVQTTPAKRADTPSSEQLRGLVARALAADGLSKAAAGEAQQQLAQYGDALDLRAFWLASHALATRADDRLALMRARDTVFERLRGGLPLAANVPTFIRLHQVGDAQGSDALANTLTGVVDRYRGTPRERSPIEGNPQQTEGYVRLCVAWGHARLGQPERAQAERAQALQCITPMDGVHGLCVALFIARIDQALSGRPPGAPLPADIQTRREALKRIERFKADRMRELSRILDPRGTFDPFELYQRADAHPHGEAFARLLSQSDPTAVAAGLDALLARDTDTRTLLGAVDVLGTLSEALSVPRARAL